MSIAHPVNDLVEACPAATQLRGVASGHAAPGQPFEITLAAYAVGREDAQLGEPFAPEMLYIRPQDMYDYAIGFLSIRPDCQPAEARAQEFEQMQYELAQGWEPPYQPVLIDFDLPF